MNTIIALKPATIIVGFPLDDKEEEQTYTFAAGTNLASALMEISPDRWGGLTFELYVGTVSLAAFVPAGEAPQHTLKSGEVWHVAVYPAEPVSATAMVTALATYLGGSTLAYVAATVIVYTAITAISMAISFGISMLLAPGKQTDKAAAPADQPTSLNGLAPPRNMMRPLSRIPDIYGRVRSWPDLIFPATSRWEMSLNPTPEAGEGRESTVDRATQYVQAVYCLGRGHYDLADFRFGDSPVSSANGTVTVYPPGATLPASVKHAYEVKTINRFELNPDQADPWSPWYSIGADSIDEIWIQVSYPGGIYYAISGKKVYPPKTFAINNVTISVQGERFDDNGNVIESLSWSTGHNAITRNELRQTYGISITPGRWRFRVAQTSPNDRWWRDVTFQGSKKAYLEGIVGFRSLSDQERTFAHETTIIVNANTTSAPAIQNMDAFNVIATRRLPTQQIGAPPGTLTGLRSDRRWITAAIHTLVDPYICNYAAREIDWASLIEVQDALESYQDPYDEGEFNGIFDRQMSADEQLQSIAKKARAIAFMSHGRVTFARDQRRTGVSAIFNRRNRMAERGNIGIGLRLPGPDEHDGVEISWLNEFDDYRQETYTYPEGITPLNPLSIDLTGATKPWEVCRRARFEYAAQRYRRRTQPLRVTEEAQLLLPYDRAGVVAPWDEGVIDGEVIEIDGSNLRLDRPVPFGVTESARIRLRAPDGRQTSLHSFSLLPPSGPEWIALSEPPTFPIVVPGDDRQTGTLYNISQDDNYDAATHWLVTGAEIDDRGVTLTLMEDADEVYQQSDDIIDPCQSGEPPPPACSPFSATFIFTDAAALIHSSESLFTPVSGGTEYTVESAAAPVSAGGAMEYEVVIETTGAEPDDQITIGPERVVEVSQSLPIPIAFVPGRWLPLPLTAQHDRLQVGGLLTMLPPNGQLLDVLASVTLVLLPEGSSPIDPADAFIESGTWSMPNGCLAIDLLPSRFRRIQGQQPDSENWPVDEDGTATGPSESGSTFFYDAEVDLSAGLPTIYSHALLLIDVGAYAEEPGVGADSYIYAACTLYALCAE